MDALGVLQFFGISLIPFAVAVITHLIFKFSNPLAVKKPEYILPDKHKYFYKWIKYPLNKFFYIVTNTKKGIYWWKQACLGIVFGLTSLFGYYFAVGVPGMGGTVAWVGNSTVSPIIAGLIFGWPAGVIAGTLSAIVRILAVVASNIEIAEAMIIALPTIVSLFTSGIITGLVSHFLFHDKRPPWYFCLLGGIFTETFNVLLIFLFNLYRISEAYEFLTKFDFICIGFSALSTSLTSLTIALIEKERIIPKKKDFNNVSNRVQSWLFIFSILGVTILGVTVRGVADAKAFEDYNKTIGYSLVDISADIKAATPVGVLPSSDEVVTYLRDIPNRHHVTSRGFVLSVAGTQEMRCRDVTIPLGEPFEIIGLPNEKRGQLPNKFYLDGDHKIYEYSNVSQTKDQFTAFTANFAGTDYLISYIDYPLDVRAGSDNTPYYIVVLVPQNEVLSSAGIVFRVALYTDIMVFIAIFSVANYFISRKIIHRIQIMDDSLEKIMEGDADTEIHIEGYNEFTNLSNNINLAVGALRNYAEEVQHRIDNELQFARDIQYGALPTTFPFEKSYNIYAKMEAAKEVGGDFYDYFKMNNGRILFLVADVSGKGIPAALFMMRARTLIKSLSSADMPLADILNHANAELCANNEANLFVTAWVGILDPASGELRYISAGHCDPLLKHNGVFTEFKNKHNVPLAALNDYKYEAEITYLEPGDEIVLYTDGVTEAQNKRQELYGVRRLVDFVNNAKYFNAKQLLNDISDDVVKYAEGEEQFDDMTMLIMRYLGNKDIIPETAITLKARPQNASLAVDFVESVLAKNELPPAFLAKISIVIDELFANIAFYAYPSGHVGEATIQVDFRDDNLYLTLIDSGKPFDPTQPREADTTSGIDDRKRGGLGIFIVKKTMDEMTYQYHDNRNILNLRKSLKDFKKKEEPKIEEGTKPEGDN